MIFFNFFLNCFTYLYVMKKWILAFFAFCLVLTAFNSCVVEAPYYGPYRNYHYGYFGWWGPPVYHPHYHYGYHHYGHTYRGGYRGYVHYR